MRGSSDVRRSAHRPRLLVPAPRARPGAHARRLDDPLRGPRARATTSSASTSTRGFTSCRASARSCASFRSARAGRSGSTTRSSTSATTSATPPSPPPAARSSCARSRRASSRQRLDRSKPLWEMWLVDGVEGDRFALVTKTHHCLVDGVSGVDITTVLFDASPDPEPLPAGPSLGRPPRAQRRPDARRGAGRACDRRRPRSSAAPAPCSAAPRQVARAADRRARGGRRLRAAPASAPRPPRSTSTIGPYRRFAWVQADLDELKRIKNAPAAPSTTSSWPPSPGALGRYLRAPRPLDPGPRAAGDGADQRPHRRRARRARQPRLLLHGAAAGRVRGPGRAPAGCQRRRWAT